MCPTFDSDEAKKVAELFHEHARTLLQKNNLTLTLTLTLVVGREGGRVRIGPCGGAPVLVMEDPTTWCHGSDPGLPSHSVPSLVGSPRLKKGSQK